MATGLRSVGLGGPTHSGFISFIIELSSSSVTGTTPDEFDLFVLDSTLTRLGSADPSGMNAVVRGFFTGRSQRIAMS